MKTVLLSAATTGFGAAAFWQFWQTAEADHSSAYFLHGFLLTLVAAGFGVAWGIAAENEYVRRIESRARGGGGT